MMSDHEERILITGATGGIGKQLLRLLKDHYREVRVLCRKERDYDNFKTYVDVALGDMSKPETLKPAFTGCSKLFLLTAAVEDQYTYEVNAIDAAKAAGISHIVRVSVADARDTGTCPWVKAHAAADRYLRASGMIWTILKTSAFFQNLLDAAPAIKRGWLPQAGGNGKACWVDTADIASVAHKILLDTSSRHHNKEYFITGPEKLSFPDLVTILSKEVGHTVRYLDLPGPVLATLLRLSGETAWTANAVTAQFVEIVRPNAEGIEPSDDTLQITGNPPTSFAEFVRREKKSFEAAPSSLGTTFVGLTLVAGLVGIVAWRYQSR